jgi:hypothetical protein
MENSRLRATVEEPTGTIAMLQRSVFAGIEDYDLLMEGNKSLMAARDEFRYRCEDLKVELARVGSDAEKNIADLEARLKSAEAHSVDVAAAGEKWLWGFEDELVKDLSELHTLHVRNTQSIGGLCSLLPEGKISAAVYLCWLSVEMSGLPDMFAGVNENFVSTAIEGTLVMAGDSVDFDGLQTTAAESEADILPANRDVRGAARVVSKKWWRSFGYNYVLAAIRAKHDKILVCV